jgi:hypothetical protein
VRNVIISVLGAALVASACCGLVALLTTVSEFAVNTGSPAYPVFQQIANRWSFNAALFGSLYSGILLFFSGLAVAIIGMRDLSTKGSNGWLVLFLSIVLGVIIANISGALYSPYCDALVCPTYTFEPPVWQFIVAYPVLSFALMVVSTLIAAGGFSLRRAACGASGARVVRLLQILPAITLTGIGLLALFLFYNPFV